MTDSPPVKRLRLELTIDGHNLAEIVRILDRISLDLDIERREERAVVSGDGHYKLTVRNDVEYTVEEYQADLLAWHERLVAERRASAVPVTDTEVT